jgi:hypothetical protein
MGMGVSLFSLQYGLETISQPVAALCVLVMYLTKFVTNVQHESRRKYGENSQAYGCETWSLSH